MIRFHNVSLRFGDKILFENLNISIGLGEKVAVTGRNGSGKTTLFRLLTGQISPDEGHVEIPTQYVIGHLAQDLPEDSELTVRHELIQSIRHIHEINLRLREIEYLMSSQNREEPEMMKLLSQQDELLQSLVYFQADKLEGEVERILQGLGFSLGDIDLPVRYFSGGWRMRIELAKLLLSKPDFILLDEPTNHLDILSIRWLEEHLRSFQGSVIVISHDIHFIDHTADRIIELDRGRHYEFKGNYTAFINYRLERKAAESREYAAQQRIIRHKESLINKFRAKANKASFAQSLISELDRMHKLEKPENEEASIRLRFKPSHLPGRKILHIKDVWKSFGAHLVLRGIDLLIERGEKISFIGRNGNGKTTLVKMIMGLLMPDRGVIEMGYRVKPAYYAQEHGELLDKGKTVLQTIEEAALPEFRTEIRNILGGLGFCGEDVEKKISFLSGGEKSRMRLAHLLVREHNLLILDEPTHHLDIPSKQRLKEAIRHYIGTVIIVSHDREFLAGLAQKTILFEDTTIKVFEGDIDYYFEKADEEQIFQSHLIKASAHDKGKKIAKDAPDNRKQLYRKIQNIERQIVSIEQAIQSMELEMSVEGFYETANYKGVVEEYQKLKNKHEHLQKEWEHLVDEIEP